ncbi:MAG: Crp/Fnr family transcriptional regulator [Chloroflexi bacterium]|nr:Crp/Fnr family transcriptional regulator [Chloroflexota bacterium]
MRDSLVRPVEVWRQVAYESFAEFGQLRPYRRNAFIFLQGEQPTAAYAVKSGRVELLSISESGREIGHSIRHPHEVFGIAEILLGHERARSMRALDDIELWVVPRDVLFTLIVDRPEITLALLNSALHRGIEQQTMKTSLIGTSARRRVAASLVYLARRSGAALDHATSIDIRVTHEQLSRLCGMTRQTVTSELDRLESEGFLALRSRAIVIQEWVGLQECAELRP